MLAILNSSGVNLVDNPPDEVEIEVQSDLGTEVTVSGYVVEDSTCLPYAWVSGSLDWNDGTQPVVFDRTSGTLLVSGSRTLTPGDYNIVITGQNYLVPTAQTASVNFRLVIRRVGLPAQPPNLIFGPILPRDLGDPNPLSWEFSTQSDLLILESSIKMLLITAKGERVMEPDYGTNIRKIIFELNTDAVDSRIEQEVKEALSRWEPRVRLQSILVKRDSSTNPRDINVVLSFLSTQSSKNFELNLQYVR